MRILAFFSFAFAVGCLLMMPGLPGWLCCSVLILLVLLAVFGFLSRGRKERAAAIMALGAVCGMVWMGCYHYTVIMPAISLSGEIREVEIELSTYPQETEYGWRAQGIAETGNARFRTHVYFEMSEDTPGLKPGDRLSGIGRIAAADDPDDNHYNYSIGIPMEIRLQAVQVQAVERIPVRFLPAELSFRLRRTAIGLYSADVVGYVAALLTGSKDLLTYQQESDLQVAGVFHALAVSGMHVSILMSVLSVLTLKNRRLYPVLGIPVLVFYCIMIGGTASVVRAAVMHMFLMASHLFRRESDTPTALGASLLVLTVQNPWCLANLGMQLSFLSTAGILLFCEKLHRWMMGTKKVKLPLLRWLRNTAVSTAACTCSALLLTLPLLAFSFGVVSTLCVVANFLVLPAITAAFLLSFLSCFGAWLAPWAGAMLAFPVTVLLRWTAFCCRYIARMPFAAIYPNSMYLVLWICLAYGCLLSIAAGRKPPGKTTGIICTGCLTITLCISLLFCWIDTQKGEFSFCALDVGQGQCLLYRSERRTAAVDCGGSYGDEAGELLARELLSGGNTRLDVLILTHYDEDHTGGVRQLLYRIPVGMILMPDVEDDSGVREELEMLAENAGTRIRYVSDNQLLTLGKGTLKVFAPVSLEGGNASSLAVQASFGTYDILATGDLSVSNELELLKREQLPDLEVLVAGHHGADSSTGLLLLRILQPEYLVISVGENTYGHPSAEVLERADTVGAEVLRTDLNGTITIRR